MKDNIIDFMPKLLVRREQTGENHFNNHERGLVILGIVAAANSLRHVKRLETEAAGCAMWLTSYADQLKSAWGVRSDFTALDALVAEINKVPPPEWIDVLEAFRPAENED